MILAQNKLQPQEEIDENDFCGRLPVIGRIYFECPYAYDLPKWRHDAKTAPHHQAFFHCRIQNSNGRLTLI
jgi:hypothetical protein